MARYVSAFMLPLVMVIYLPMISQDAVADETAPAIAKLFDEAVVADDVHAVLLRTRKLPQQERYVALLRWVFPNENQTIRLMGATVRSSHGPGHNVISPVFDLLEIAKETGRLSELADRLDALKSSLPGRTEKQLRSDYALRALVALEAQDKSAADTAIVRLMELVRVAPFMPARDKWPELLVASRGVTRHSSQGTVHDLVSLLREALNAHPPQGDDEAFRNLVCGLIGEVRWQTETKSETDEGVATRQTDWIPTSGSASRAGGTGLVAADWRKNSSNEFLHVTGHLDDFLLYAIPLSGSFEITGEIAGHGQTQLLLGGQILGAAAEQQRATGIFRTGVIAQPIDPLLQWSTRWVRFRAQFTEDRLRLFLNGRLVSDEPLGPNRSPWIGFHSCWWAEAAMRNVLISGSPRIPDAVAMSESPPMEEWRSYFHQSVGFEGASWCCSRNADGHSEIIGRRATEIGETPCESVLHYVRPLRDGDRVEYDFYCDESTEPAHPVLGSTAYVIRPEGVMIHEVTNAEFEQRELSPDHLRPLETNWIVAQPSLKPGKWNHLEIAIEGNTVGLTLNGARIANVPLPSTAPQPFGLFHFSERSEARARNIQLKGRWPTELPALSEQSLADLATFQIDQRIPELEDSFKHDFVGAGPNSPLIRVAPVQQTNHRPHPHGLASSCQSTGSWEATELSAGVELHGDFDLEVAFEKMGRMGTGWSGIMLNVEFANATEHLARAMLAKDPNAMGPMLQASLSELRNGERFYDHFDIVDCDSTEGRLRIARRGELVHYLFAEGDSPTFRVFGERKVSTAPTKVGGVKLVLNCHAGAQCNVIWKSLSARAERIVEHPEAPTRSVEELDRTRDQLAAAFEYDFAAEGLNADRFFKLYADPNGVQKVDNGVKVTKTSQGSWSFTQLLGKTRFTGDFDLEVEFEELKLTGKEHAGVLLAANLDDATSTSHRLVRQRDALQRQNVHSQLQTTTPKGTTFETFDGWPCTLERGRMRIARRGQAIYFLMTNNDAKYQIVNQRNCLNSASTRQGIKLECLANGTSTSSIVWKKLRLRAENIE
jgi:hypothetical protein